MTLLSEKIKRLDKALHRLNKVRAMLCQMFDAHDREISPIVCEVEKAIMMIDNLKLSLKGGAKNE